MRRPRTFLGGMLCVMLVGCATSNLAKPTTWLDRFHPFRGPTGADVVQLDVAMIERPVGDRYLNQGLWEAADEQVVPLEKKAVLEDNGFRIGQIAGCPPAPLMDLLTSEVTCVNPRRLQLHAGGTTTLVLGPDLADCVFQLQPDNDTKPVTLHQAQCTLAVVPSLTSDGRTRLRFTPQVLHGDNAVVFRSAADRSGWVLQEQRPRENYEGLAWEVTLTPNEFLVIGGRFDEPQTLGNQCFVRQGEKTPVQRLLAIRTGRVLPGLTDDPTPRGTPEATPGEARPLAYQAAWTTVRGSSP